MPIYIWVMCAHIIALRLEVGTMYSRARAATLLSELEAEHGKTTLCVVLGPASRVNILVGVTGKGPR